MDTDAEYFGAEMRRPLLERIAAETGGRFYTPATVDSLASDLGYSGRGATVEEFAGGEPPALLITTSTRPNS